MKKYLMTILRIAVAVGGVAYIAYALDWTDHVDASGEMREGIATTLRKARVDLLVAALAVTGLIFPLLTVRWWMLMRARGIEVTLGKAFRLCMVGNFFNYCMPGTTGGDLVKAYYAARGTTRKADSVMCIIVDRGMGLMGLFVVAGVAGLFMLEHEVARHITAFLWTCAGIGVLGAAIYFSRRMRKLLRLDHWLVKLPGGKLLAKVDSAAVAFRDHKLVLLAALAMGAGVHVCLVMAASASGYALGMDRPLVLLITIVPVLFLAGAVPISYQGLGVMEAVGAALLVSPPHCTTNQMVGMLMLVRVYQMFYSLLGSLFLLRGDIHLHPQEAK